MKKNTRKGRLRNHRGGGAQFERAPAPSDYVAHYAAAAVAVLCLFSHVANNRLPNNRYLTEGDFLPSGSTRFFLCNVLAQIAPAIYFFPNSRYLTIRVHPARGQQISISLSRNFLYDFPTGYFRKLEEKHSNQCQR